MCFFINNANPHELIAKHDIVCYKKFSFDEYDKRRVVGYYQSDFLWWDTRRKSDTVHKNATLGFPKNYIYSGIHSYSNKKKIYRHDVARKCVIPKGAKYYYNPKDKEYVSNELIVYINKPVFK